jgi:hypothetical protein
MRACLCHDRRLLGLGEHAVARGPGPVVDSDRWPDLTFAAESVRRARIVRFRSPPSRGDRQEEIAAADVNFGRRGLKPRSKAPLRARKLGSDWDYSALQITAQLHELHCRAALL